MWTNKFNDTPIIKKGTGTALGEAFRVYCRLMGKPRSYRIFRDNIGRLGFEMGSVILLAKNSMNGDAISCQSWLFDYAVRGKKRLLVYIKDTGFFYRFEPELIKERVENERGGQRMVNFSIREGQNIMRLRSRAVKEDMIVEKNQELGIKELCKLGIFG